MLEVETWPATVEFTDPRRGHSVAVDSTVQIPDS